MLKTRSSGVLLHISSLPSAGGIGDFGPEAYRFVDFLQAAGQRDWQVLPLNPAGGYHSPYDAVSVMAGNTMFISPERLVTDGMVTDAEPGEQSPRMEESVDFPRIEEQKTRLLAEVCNRADRILNNPRFEQFCSAQADWLDDYALFASLRRSLRQPEWQCWPAGLRDRQAADLREARNELREEIRREKLCQFIFFHQWHELKKYANRKGIRLIGDLPFFVAQHSAEVWAAPGLFKLTADRQPRFVSGVPPDRFNADGQLWGNPVYDWEYHSETGYAWWLRRLQHNFTLYDAVRIDHFRGFAACWELPADSDSAQPGHWEPAPGEDFLKQVFRRFPFAPLLAEDLGTITPDVRELIDRFALPGAAVLQFAFENATGPDGHAPHHLRPNQVVYPGTHDNNTCRGWFEEETDAATRERLCEYLGRTVDADGAAEALIRLGMMSVCRMSLAPLQDWMDLGSGARMNFPGRPEGNWQWRLRPGQASETLAVRMARMTETYGRV